MLGKTQSTAMSRLPDFSIRQAAFVFGVGGYIPTTKEGALKNSVFSVLKWALVGLLSISILNGCGGGGGGSDSSEPTSSSGDIFTFSEDSLAFSYSLSEPEPESQILNVGFGSANRVEVGYPPGVPAPAWLNVAKVDTDDNSSPVDIRFSLETTELTEGNHSTVVRFVAYDLAGEVTGHKDLPVTCVVYNQLGLGTSELFFTHTSGSPTTPESQFVSIYGGGLTWTASADQPWVVLTDTSGTAPSSLEVNVNPDGLSAGNHSASITVINPDDGQTEEVTVDLTIETQKLLVGDNGVAFSSFPAAPSALTYSVRVFEDAGASINWTASTLASWLDVTPSGVTGDSLTLTADPSGLAEDTIHYATVTVSSSDPSISNTETITVGFYVSSTDPAVTELLYHGKAIAADPIRPYVYVADASTIYGDDEAVIDIINIYTGTTVGTITAGRDISAMTASSDGQTLYVADGHDSTIVPIALDTLTPGAKWAGSDLNLYGKLVYTRFNGKGFVITSGRQIFDAADGALDATIGYPMSYFITMAASQENSSFYVSETGLSGYSYDLARYVGRYSAVNDSLSIGRTHMATYYTYIAKDIAVNKDGSKIYLASGTSASGHLRSFLFDNVSLTESTPLSGGTLTVETGLDERLFAGVSDEPDLLSFDTDNTPGPTYTLPGTVSGPHCLSGDGLQIIHLTSASYDHYLAITPTTP
jgi:hypothetical protein